MVLSSKRYEVDGMKGDDAGKMWGTKEINRIL
jgi:hypothetical protein